MSKLYETHYLLTLMELTLLSLQCPECNGKRIRLLKDSSHYRDYRWVKLEEPLERRKGGATREFKGYMQDYLKSISIILKR